MTEVADPVTALLEGKVQTVEFSNGNVVVDAPRSGRVYMAGSFNPLHDGHRGMLAAALKARQDKQGWLAFPLCAHLPLHTNSSTAYIRAFEHDNLVDSSVIVSHR